MIGIHNIRNATASLAVAFTIGISDNFIKKGLKNFKGVQRRFNFIFKHHDSLFFDDYAHHPTEIKEVLNSVKTVYKNSEIICVFQPHRISRLSRLRKEFSKAFIDADRVILCPIYKAGENLKLNFSYKFFAKELIKNSKVKLININNQYDLAKYTNQNIFGKKIVVAMGAGTISNWIREIPELLK